MMMKLTNKLLIAVVLFWSTDALSTLWSCPELIAEYEITINSDNTVCLIEYTLDKNRNVVISGTATGYFRGDSAYLDYVGDKGMSGNLTIRFQDVTAVMLIFMPAFSNRVTLFRQ